MALDDINDNKSGLLTNYKLTAKIMDGECKPSTVMKKFIDIIMNDKVMRDFIGILGENDFALCSVFFYLSTIENLDRYSNKKVESPLGVPLQRIFSEYRLKSVVMI